MPTLQELESAFIKADDAAQQGDAQAQDDAAAFASEIKRMRAAGPDEQPARAEWSELPGNIIPSAINTAEGIYNMVRHPVDTVENLAKVGSGALNNAFPQLSEADQWLADKGLKTASDPNAVAEQQEMASQTGAALTDRYWGLDNIRNTVITDPVGAGLDVATVYAGGAALARRGPLAASKVANIPRIPGQTRASEALLRRAAPKSPTDFAALGDDAMVLDASPSMTGLAQGVAVKPSPHSDKMIEALTARHEGRSDRLLHGAQNTLGRLRDPEALKTTIDKAGQRAAGPHYRLAKENPPDIRTPGLENLVSLQMTEPMKGMSLSKRTKTLEYFNKIEDAWAADTPQDVVSRLHSLRKELDTKIYDTMTVSGEDKIVAKEVRGIVDDILKNRVPGFMEGDKIISTSKKAQDDIDFGFNSLEGGKSAMFPETFAKEYGKRDPKYVTEGIKGKIAHALGTNANDTAALKRVVGDGNDFNRRKLVKALGQDKTDAIVKSVDREQLFGQNFADITRNSQTARRQSAQKLVEGEDAPRISQGASVVGLGYTGAAKGLNALLARGVTKYSGRNAEALAKALVLKGAEARKLVNDLAKSQTQSGKLRKIVQALIASHVTESVNRPHR